MAEYCRKCGAGLADDGRFCESCGTAREVPAPTKLRPPAGSPAVTERVPFNWARMRTPALILASMIGLAALSLGVFFLFNAWSDLQNAQADLTEMQAQSRTLRSSIQDTNGEASGITDELKTVEAASTKLNRKIERLTGTLAADTASSLVAADPQQAVETLRTAWIDDDRAAASQVADENVLSELFGVPLDERDDYAFHGPECDEQPDGSAVCTFQYYACCPALIIFEWRGSEGYKAASISNPAD